MAYEDISKIHSPRLNVRVPGQGWFKCPYVNEGVRCNCFQHCNRPGEHECEKCNRWLEIVFDPNAKKEEKPKSPITDMSALPKIKADDDGFLKCICGEWHCPGSYKSGERKICEHCDQQFIPN